MMYQGVNVEGLEAYEDYNELAVGPLCQPPQFDRNYSFSRNFPKSIYHSRDLSYD